MTNTCMKEQGDGLGAAVAILPPEGGSWPEDEAYTQRGKEVKTKKIPGHLWNLRSGHAQS